MPIYAVQRKLPGITMESLAGAQKAAIDTSNKFSDEGTSVKYIRSNFYPGDSRCNFPGRPNRLCRPPVSQLGYRP